MTLTGAQRADARTARRRVTIGGSGHGGAPTAVNATAPAHVPAAWAPFTDKNTLLESPLPNCSNSRRRAIALSPIRREIADSCTDASHLDGNFQCRRWYDLFAANAGNAFRYTGPLHWLTARSLINLVPLSGEMRLSGANEMSSHRTRTDALKWSVKPPENSRAFTASSEWPPSRRIRKPVLRRRSPVSSGVDDTGNLTFVHNLMASLVEKAATAIALQHRLKYR
jgi:hypothetical protein